MEALWFKASVRAMRAHCERSTAADQSSHAPLCCRSMRIEPEVTQGPPRYFKHSLRQNVTRKLLHRRRHVPQRRCLVFIGNRARTVAADRVPHAGFNAGTRRQPLEGVPPAVKWRKSPATDPQAANPVGEALPCLNGAWLFLFRYLILASVGTDEACYPLLGLLGRD